MKLRIIVIIITLSFIIPLINGCGNDEGKSGHGSMSQGGGGDMNFEQQALKMEQDDLAKLKQGPMQGQDFAKIHKGVVDAHDPNEVIATVNGENILRLELDKIMNMIKNRVGRSRRYTVEKRILDDLVTQLLLKQFIKKEGVQVDQDSIAQEIEKFRINVKENPDTKDKTLEQVLGEQGGSIDELRVALDISFSIDKYLSQAVSEEDLKAYFDKNIGNFNGEKVTASHILIDTVKVKGDEEKLKEAKEKIDKIKKELDEGADFAELAKKYSDCPSAMSGGNLGPFGRGEMVKEFIDTAFSLDVNSVSSPVKTQFGYHIIKVTDKKEGKDINFEEVKERVTIALHNEKTISLIEDLNKKADIKITLKETPQLEGGHGSYAGTSGGGHGGSFGASPHWNVQRGSAPHGDMSGGSPHGGASSEKKVDPFSLTN